MKLKSLIVIPFFLTLASAKSFAQDRVTTDYLDFTAGAARFQGSLALSYVHDWKFGVQKKFGVGVGARFTSYLAANQYYITAPAQLTSESTSPLILFKDNVAANIDTLLIKAPQTNSINLTINIDYRITQKITVGFNIDAIGFSFGGTRSSNYINGPAVKMVNATPTPFNILLISDNDRGSLNSEFFVRYFPNAKWGVKVGAQFLFTEYTTETKVQQVPQDNDRFRNKSLLACLGVSYKLD